MSRLAKAQPLTQLTPDPVTTLALTLDRQRML